MNIKVGMLFYVLSLFLSFFSRKIFLDCLSAEFIGLTGTLQDILSFLNVAELGIGTSIIYFLYKPIQENNHERINEIVSILAYLYTLIGYGIGFTGIIISLSFPFIFSNQPISLLLIYFTFFAFIATSMAGYIFNYKQLLVTADQKQYLVTGYFQTISIVQSLVQILLAYYYKNLYLWVSVGLLFTIIGCLIFNYRISKIYPWLRIDLKHGRKLLKDYPDILKKTRQVFVQKMKNFILYRSDQILIFFFTSLKMVAYYGNYMIIINKLNVMVNIITDGVGAAVGNIVAENDKKNIIKVFWELTATRFLITGAIIFGLIMFIQPFIVCWLGEEYQLNNLIVYLLLFNLFLMLSRGIVEGYIASYGLFSDVWAAWAELATNLAVTLLLAPFWGIVGILLGKIISIFFIAIFWKPYFLFSKGMQLKVSVYWRGMMPYYIIFGIFTLLSVYTNYALLTPQIHSFGQLIYYGILIYPLFMLSFFITMFIFTTGTRYFVARKPQLYHKIVSIKDFLTISNKTNNNYSI